VVWWLALVYHRRAHHVTGGTHPILKANLGWCKTVDSRSLFTKMFPSFSPEFFKFIVKLKSSCKLINWFTNSFGVRNKV
jgi:hypothetical protein